MKGLVISLALAALAVGCGGDAPTDTEDVGTILMGRGNDNGATVWRGDIGCSVLDAEGYWFPEDWSLPCGTEVAVSNKNLNAKVTVQASGVPNETGRTVHWYPYDSPPSMVTGYPELSGPPYPCLVLGTDHDLDNPLWTVNWHANVTPSGQGTLVCHYKRKWEFHCEDFDNCAGDPWP